MNGLAEALEQQPKTFLGSREHLRRFIQALDQRAELDEMRPDRSASWNNWRKSNPRLRPDLRGLDLTMVDINGFRIGDLDLSNCRLAHAQMNGLRAWFISLSGADLRHANLDGSDVSFGNLSGANLEFCRFIRANLSKIDGKSAIFRHANLSHAVLNGAELQGADLRGAKVVGLSTWAIEVDKYTKQDGLILEELGDFLEDLSDDRDQGYKPRVIGRVDQIDAIQLLYLIKDKRKLKTVIDALTNNLVLILGNFSLRRKSILRAVEDKLADLGYAPVIFDFDAPEDRDLIETVALLAGLSCFIVVDLTRPHSTPLETMLVAPQLGVPLASIIQAGEKPFSMFSSLHAKYSWVLPTWTYKDEKQLISKLNKEIVIPCEKKRAELRRRRKAIAASVT